MRLTIGGKRRWSMLLLKPMNATRMLVRKGSNTPIPSRRPAPPPAGEQKKGAGNFGNDCPRVMGTIGRPSGQVRLHVLQRTTKVEVQKQLSDQRLMNEPEGTCYTDEHLAYWEMEKIGPTMPPSATVGMNRLVMTMAMELMRFTLIRWRIFGQVCATTCVPFVESASITCTST